MSFALAQETHGYSQAQLVRMGWTRRTIARLLPEPDVNTFVRRGCCCRRYVYLASRVERAMAAPEFAAARERAELRQTAGQRRQAELTLRYGAWQMAAGAACRALFSLNRWAKHRECTPDVREEIYGLKDDLIEMLYGAGYCASAWVHRMEQPAQECWGCFGDGCGRCNDTGEFRPARTLKFVAFRFAVDGTAYCWHQPERLVRFAVRLTEPEAEWAGTGEEKPVRMGRRGLRRALELLRWVVARRAAAAA